MVDNNEKILEELQKKSGNNVCADCGSEDPDWASYNLGIFICMRCASIHRGMGAHISKVKHLNLDRWEDSQVQRMKEVGNIVAKNKYEERVPPCYRKPNKYDPQVLIEQWIRAKYEREEFCHPERQSYLSGSMEGFLMKRGKEDSRYQLRKFVLNENEDSLKYHHASDGCGRAASCLDRLFDRLRIKNIGRWRYHVRENREPKGVLKLSELNVCFAPAKIGHMNSMQLTFMKDGSTRHIYVYHEEPEVINNWYTAIRCAQLHLLQVAFPSMPQSELVLRLPKDFAREGWLWKTGPRPSDAHRRRWFTLDNRKLMYHDEPLDAYPKGEIFVGHESNGYHIRVSNTGNGCKEARFPFQLVTPDRIFCLAATTHDDRSGWLAVLQQTIKRPLTPQDSTIEATLVRKRTTSNSINIFSGR
ncbi:arf-GAP with dual PH domain-containing protein 1-like isoform X1 [Galleria mellonella]|uniref:Arf-GAP with dual PH domain-containing protein 1-like isoform X1 n=1 Tax=Galleria mellonella TaxID=7137 RepID=A0A6J3C863_GALME|nr:arf-GAP with dual PH domain-containing protein 1-like isoform X1 [Galleria mellonella]